MKLSLEVCVNDAATVIYCKGRIAYCERAAALSERVAHLLPRSRQLVLELSGVEMIDSAGLGELVEMHRLARTTGCSMKLAAPRRHVRQLLELTNLASVFEIYASVEEAVPGLHGQVV